MAKPQKDLSNQEEATLFEMLDYLCSKIDFGQAFLDNTAIRCMNALFTNLRNNQEKHKIE